MHPSLAQNDDKKLKMKREIPPVVTFEPSEESSKDEETIRYFVFCVFHCFWFLLFFFLYSNLRRIRVAKAKCQTSPGSGSVGPTTGIQGKGNQSLPYTVKWINGKKYFECNVCTKTYLPFLSHFKIHLLVHTGEKPYVCHVCEKSSNHNSNLQTHMRLHIGEKIACDICKISGSTRSTSSCTNVCTTTSGPTSAGAARKSTSAPSLEDEQLRATQHRRDFTYRFQRLRCRR